MRITLERVNGAIHFEGRNEAGDSIEMGTSERNGGLGRGVSPMQTLLMALAGCSGIDVLMILAKSRQQPESFRIVVDGDRRDGRPPTPFTNIGVHFELTGEVEPSKVERAVRLSMEKYCSVSANLKPQSEIRYSFSVNGQHYECA